MRCSVWPIDLHRSSHRRARSRPLPCHSQRHSQCWQQGASLAVPSQGRILEAPRTPLEAAPARRPPAVAAATGNPGHSLASRIQVARGCSKNAKDFGESKVSEYNFRKENLLSTGILIVCFSIELNELQISRCLKHFHRSVQKYEGSRWEQTDQRPWRENFLV